MTASSIASADTGFIHRPPASIASAVAVIRDPLTSLPPEVFTHRLVRSDLFGRSRLFVCDPDLIQEALVRNAAALEKGEESLRVLGNALGTGLMTSNGAAWKWQRQTIAPAFQTVRVRDLVPAMIAAAEETRNRWLAAVDGTAINLGDAMTSTTFDIIAETMLSGRDQIDAAGIKQGIADFLSAANWSMLCAILKLPRWLPYPGKARSAAATRFCRSVIEEMVRRRRASPTEQRDLVALLLKASDPETGRAMTDSEVTDNLLTFIAAGHETTALALNWALALIARHPDVAARVCAEIDGVVGSGPVEADHIDRLTYLKQVFYETIRLYPSAALNYRQAVADFELDGHQIRAGTAIVFPIYAIHRHARLWEQPALFDPDRFEPARVKARHRYAFMPFGAGHRVCIGAGFATMEAIAILAVLLQSIRLEPTIADIAPPRLSITLRPREEIPMRIYRRRDVRP